jgi:hypothetical protein
VLNAQFGTQAKSDTDTRPVASIPIEEKKTFAWIEGLRDCVELDKQPPNTHQVCVMDREADFELFDEQRKTDKVDLLVRSRHDRTIDDEGGICSSQQASPACGEMVIQVPRQSTRTKKSKQQAKPGHVQRSATVALRYLDIGRAQGCTKRQGTDPAYRGACAGDQSAQR